jgi:galactose oxidase
MKKFTFSNKVGQTSSRLIMLAMLSTLAACGQPLAPTNPYLAGPSPWEATIEPGVRLNAMQTGDNFLSDLTVLEAQNGWGPYELDRSNGENNANDGRVMSLNGRQYSKGLGVHAYSLLRFDLNAACTSFSSDIGLDDEIDDQTQYGSVVYKVLLDGIEKYNSGVMRQNEIKNVNLNINGARELKLIVEDAGDNNWYDHANWADAKVSCTVAGGTGGSGNGLSATYWDNIDFTGPNITRTDGTVNFNWGVVSPDSSIGVDSFSARWTGQIQPTSSGDWTFYTTSDDGIRLDINGQRVIENWSDHAPTTNSGKINLQAGQKYDIKLEFYENGGGAVSQLFWESAAQARQVVPKTQLYSSTGGTVTGGNLALKKATTQSSTDYGSISGRAVDGNSSGLWSNQSVTHTTLENQPWWQVDLGSSSTLAQVNVWNRTDCCGARMSDWYVLVSNDPITGTLTQALGNISISSYHFTSPAGSPTGVKLNAGQTGRYVRIWLNATNFLQLAEVEVLAGATTIDPKAKNGSWSGIINLPLVSTSAANLPNGKILLWAGNTETGFGGGGTTSTAIFDPATQTASARQVSETNHEMFCPGTALLANGEVLVNGGSNAEATSIYNSASNTWRRAQNMNVPRGYNASVTLENGNVFTLGGSWSGGQGGKNGEVWNANNGWTNLANTSADPLYGYESAYRSDNHSWLFASGNRVLYAGPGNKMTWYDTTGTGGLSSAGTRGNDAYSQNGNAVMYDRNKILTLGGAPTYSDGSQASNRSYVIDLSTGAYSNPTVRQVGNLNFARGMGSSVLLPDGQVLALGGMPKPVAFSETDAILTPEVWNPQTERWRTLANYQVPRVYHSVALLMPDARVISAGGGLCGGCNVNHSDAEIFTPPYLFNADGSLAARPSIGSAPDVIGYGGTFNVTVSGGATKFNLIRMGSITHTVNNDQRLIPLGFSQNGGTFNVATPENSSIATPGYYMLFALNAAGVPSAAKILKVQ